MKTIADYKNPFDAIPEFESAVAKYTGAPYCVTTDCCTHAMEIAFRFSTWATQKTFRVGYHYTMRPEECVLGLNLLEAQAFTEQLDKYFDYPDCRDITIND